MLIWGATVALRHSTSPKIAPADTIVAVVCAPANDVAAGAGAAKGAVGLTAAINPSSRTSRPIYWPRSHW